MPVQTLIGDQPLEVSDHAAVLRLGPADADWSDLGAPIELAIHLGRGAAETPSGDAATCLTQAIYYEARSEPLEGQQAVAQVVMNRTRTGRYGNSVCGVVYERSGAYGTCQFTFVCDGSMRRPMQGEAWERAQTVATQALHGFELTPLKDAMHYHADYVSPAWSVTLPRIRQIGRHIFYQ
jgi:spore germination cell wall hydrolase CwlJ-like protein